MGGTLTRLTLALDRLQHSLCVVPFCRDIRRTLLAMNGNKKLLREIPGLIRETIRPLLLRLLPILRPAVFAALRPPLQEQYARWTGPNRNVPEPDVPYVGDLVRMNERL